MIVKHNNPCGARSARAALEAYQRALACDPLSAYGGVVVLNTPVDAEFARGARASSSSRCCSRPASTRARSRSSSAQEHPPAREGRPPRRRATSRRSARSRAACSSRTATSHSRQRERHARRHPARADRGRVGGPAVRAGASASTCARTRSSSPRDCATVGIGAGQMSRVDSVRLAIEKARRGPLAGSRARLRRVLPVRRRPRARDRGRRRAVIQPRRLDPRRRGDRRRRRGGRRDGHSPAARHFHH